MDVTCRDISDLYTSTCIEWWPCFTGHNYGHIESIMWAYVREQDVGLTHFETLLRLLCCYVLSVGLKQRWCIILRPDINMISYMCNSTTRGYQTLLRNWIIIKVSIMYAMKHTLPQLNCHWLATTLICLGLGESYTTVHRMPTGPIIK